MAKLLVIDDERLNRLTLRKILERGHHEVVDAANGAEGLKLAKSEAFDLVITDVVMPTMEGIETITLLKRAFPNLPIIAMSGSAATRNHDNLELALSAGADQVLPKPFTSEKLLAAVASILA